MGQIGDILMGITKDFRGMSEVAILEKRKLPAGWRWVRLGEICEIIAGQSPPGSTYRKTPEGLPFFQGKADFGRKHPVARTWCIAPTKIASAGDILISVRAPVGPTNIADQECCIGRGLAAIRPGNQADRDFVLATLKLYESNIVELGSGSTFSAIKREHLEFFEVPLPPLAEQKRIVAILNEQMAAVEKARTAAEAQLQTAKTLPAAYLREVFNSPEAQKWPKKSFGDLVDNFDGKRVPVKVEDRRTKKGPFPYYGASGIIDYVDSYLFEGEYLLIGEDGANLVMRSSPIAFKATGKFWVNNHAHVVRPRNGVSIEYLIYFFAATDLKPYVTGAAQPKLTQRDLNAIQIPVSSPEVHQYFLVKLSEKIDAAEKLKNQMDEQLAAITGLPSALLRKAFDGEL
ncbi:MAG: restriction endonuclease subunit S [Elusimicrobia bacterium]|nr:restriction endonuclease subunit S [Elusimicrobiota bacterium]